MPSIGVHLRVGYEVEQATELVLNRRLFYLGILAPDVTMITGVKPLEEPVDSHFRELDVRLWKFRILQFYDDMKKQYPVDYCFGYLVHLLTDLFFDDKFYWELRTSLTMDGFPVQKQAKKVWDELIAYDRSQSTTSWFLKIVRELKKDSAVTLPFGVTMEEMERYQYYLLSEYFQNSERIESTLITHAIVSELSDFVIEAVLDLH